MKMKIKDLQLVNCQLVIVSTDGAPQPKALKFITLKQSTDILELCRIAKEYRQSYSNIPLYFELRDEHGLIEYGISTKDGIFWQCNKERKYFAA
jgi:hypothetical protein